MAFNLKMESEFMSTPLNHRTQHLTLTRVQNPQSVSPSINRGALNLLGEMRVANKA